ncbi:MAG: alginate O-acetyltransferase complex protein AlgI [Pseudohongiellaceae bacterium]|jgi:alginate O-acetyltransferase complex protein AlgI
MIILFHQPAFLVFLVATLLVYWGLPSRRRNLLLLVASYVFYTSWNPKFAWCLVASTVIDFWVGRAIHASSDPRHRKRLLTLSLVANLGMLGFFKYSNFFLESLVALADGLGVTLDIPTLNIFLPIGISFYTFQTLSYSIDVYRKKLEPTTSFLDFALFVVFFPQLIAGPIEKARDLLPQLAAPRFLKDVDWKKGLYLYAYGCFLKIAIADPVGHMVNETFGSQGHGSVLLGASGAQVLMALYGYALQIYCDFSGYSKMARGLACLFGINLSRNFYMPFFSTGYIDFYKRWHITLSNWIGEYVYMPIYYALPKMRLLKLIKSTGTRLYVSASLALLITRIVFGLWHGASMSFVLLGLFIYVGQLVSVYVHQLTKNMPLRNNVLSAALGRPLQSLMMLHMFAFAMLFFRSADVNQVFTFAGQLFTDLRFTELYRFELIWTLFIPAAFIFVYELFQYRRDDEFLILKQGGFTKLAFALTCCVLWLLADAPDAGEFIYFQF